MKPKPKTSNTTTKTRIATTRHAMLKKEEAKYEKESEEADKIVEEWIRKELVKMEKNEEQGE